MVAVGPDWERLLDAIEGRVVMVVGRVGSGKSTLARWLASALAARSGVPRAVALLDTDMGQASIGPPTCLGLALAPPWIAPAAAWFVGDTSPVGNLLPAVVGAARLSAEARKSGARTIVVDTTGLVDGPVARVLKLHKGLAIGAERVIAVQQGDELEPMLALLAGPCGEVQRVAAAPEARDRTQSERRQYREARLRAYFEDGQLITLGVERLLRSDWTLSATDADVDAARPCTLVGLLDTAGFCRALGVIVEVTRDRIAIYTPLRDVTGVARIQLGRLRLGAGCEELRGREMI